MDDHDHEDVELDLGDLFGVTTGDWPQGDVVHEAASGRVYVAVRSDLLGNDVVATTGPMLEAFERAGATRVGDLVCDASPTILIRGVADERARWFGVLVVPPYVEVVVEVYSRFADGSSLTTTTNPFAGLGGPGLGIYREPLPAGTPPDELVRAHERAVAEHELEKATSVELVRPDLVGLAAAFDEFLVRQAG